MKFGLRKPSLKGMISARTSPSRFLRHSLGFKAPRGWGWLTNPKKAAYNRVYSRTTFSLIDLLSGGRRRSRSSSGGCGIAVLVLFGIGLLGSLLESTGGKVFVAISVIATVAFFILSGRKPTQQLAERAAAEAEEFEIAQRARVIAESLELVNGSKNYDTRTSRLELVISNLEAIRDKYPHRTDIIPELDKAYAHRMPLYTAMVEEKIEKHMAISRVRKTSKSKLREATLAMETADWGLILPHTDKAKLQHLLDSIREYAQQVDGK